MSIREIKLETSSYNPGENLYGKAGEWTHVTISYDISGAGREREKVDRHIHRAIENGDHLQKIECVNTTIYWQTTFECNDDKEEVNDSVKTKVKEKLEEIFVNYDDLSGLIVTAYCAVGNIRAFAFKIGV
jgi:hypothetical protein